MSRPEANLKAWVVEAAAGEPIEAIVIGHRGGGEDRFAYDENIPTHEIQRTGVVLTWEEAAPMIDYTFDDGFGGADCNAVYAWTATRVIAISEYDGSTDCYSIPRHPVDCLPEMA
jgi:hypothetical protein